MDYVPFKQWTSFDMMSIKDLHALVCSPLQPFFFIEKKRVKKKEETDVKPPLIYVVLSLSLSRLSYGLKLLSYIYLRDHDRLSLSILDLLGIGV